MACIVPGCKSNYKSQDEFTTSFNFPKDQELREKWYRAIPRSRADYENNKQLKVSLLLSHSIIPSHCSIFTHLSS